MSVLTDATLRPSIDTRPDGPSAGKLGISPYSEDCLTPVGYDLRIGDEYSVSHRANKFALKEGERFTIKPTETVFITILERLTMPIDKSISGLVLSKVSITAKGLTHDATTVDPDWAGNLLLVLHNLSNNKITLEHGQPICTIVFLKNTAPSEKPSQKDNKRNALLVELWSEMNSKAVRGAWMRRLAAPLLILVAFILGLLFFDNAPGLVASVAAGVALSQFLRDTR